MGTKKLSSGIASFAAGVILLLAPATALAGNDNDHGNDNEHNKVKICHATGNGGYVLNMPNANGDVDGHAKHGDDIIPPFDYNDHSTTKHFAGLNWTAQGQAIWNNGCKVPEGGHGGCDEDNTHDEDCVPQKGSITIVKHLSPTNDPGLFNLIVNDHTVAANVGNGGQGTKDRLVAGSYTVSETAGTNTAMSNYTTSYSCTNELSGSTTSFNVSLTAGANVTCTFTNTRVGGQGGGDMCINIDGVQTEVPSEMVRDEQGNCTTPSTPQTDCDGDTDSSPSTECETTTTTTTSGTPQVLGESTTSQVTAVPAGSVNGGEGAASRINSGASMFGLVAAVISVGSGLALLNRKQN